MNSSSFMNEACGEKDKRLHLASSANEKELDSNPAVVSLSPYS